MKQQKKSEKVRRQRKFLLVLPMLVLPFTTLIFWSLGGGKKADGQAVTEVRKGLDMTLPDVHTDGRKYLSKMDYYHQAILDSNKRREQIKKDPYYHNDTASLQKPEAENHSHIPAYHSVKGDGNVYGDYSDPNEAKVYQKLEQLKAVLNKTDDTIAVLPTDDNTGLQNADNTAISSSDINRLEQMMQTMNQPEGPDPEMRQLNSMLEKIMDIQHPQRVRNKIRQASETKKGQVFAVSAEPKGIPIPSLDNRQVPYTRQNGFYSLDNPKQINQPQNAIEAVVHETQTVVNGSTIKLRLLNDIYVNGLFIPKNNFVFGQATLNGERLKIKINSIRYKNSIFPVNLSAYDLDGMNGIYIPGAITRNVAKQSADRSIQTFGLTTLDPSWQAQAAGAGIEAAKTLFSKKVKLVKVTVKAGYRVLLHDDKQKKEN